MRAWQVWGMPLPWRRLAVACAVLGLLPAGPVGAEQDSSAQVCRQGQVEWIIGGPTTACAGSQRAAARPAAPGARTAGEPRISTAAQAERDKDRRRILSEELARERQTLAEMTRPGEPADPARLSRTQANLAALEKELARVRP